MLGYIPNRLYYTLMGNKLAPALFLYNKEPILVPNVPRAVSLKEVLILETRARGVVLYPHEHDELSNILESAKVSLGSQEV